MEINSTISLFGESTFWLFTRTSEQGFNKDSNVIKISKEDKSQRCFISLGTFLEVEGISNQVLKTFSKRQLINFANFSTKENKNSLFFIHDQCDFNIKIVDTGSDKVFIKIQSIIFLIFTFSSE
jgi:hypothetical protein